MADLSALFDVIGKNSKPAATGPVEYMVVCLGNPGKQYENTRHNVGFITADMIAEKRGFKIDKLRFQSLTGERMIAGKRVLFINPSTFMNLSGQAVVEAMNFHKLPIEKVLVIHDDVSLAPGRLRLRAKGSHGGHNGLKNIIYLTGKDTFPRIKIGVGDKPHPDYDMADWGRGSFKNQDALDIDEAVEKAWKAVENLIAEGVEKTQSKFY